jgi:hypothetical protein
MSIERETVEQRKALPLASGVLDYFPDALLAVAEVSRVGNEQHHPGEPLHWDKSKSTDEADALLRHLLDRGTRDTDGMRHSAKVAWRALALLQRELDAEAAAVADDPVLTPQEVHDIRLLTELEATMRSLGIEPEPWGIGDGPVFVVTGGERPTFTEVDKRGVDGYLICCGATEHTLECPLFHS